MKTTADTPHRGGASPHAPDTLVRVLFHLQCDIGLELFLFTSDIYIGIGLRMQPRNIELPIANTTLKMQRCLQHKWRQAGQTILRKELQEHPTMLWTPEVTGFCSTLDTSSWETLKILT